MIDRTVLMYGDLLESGAGQCRRGALLTLVRNPAAQRQRVLDIDWLLQLPTAIDDRLWGEVQHFKQVAQMRYVTSVERIGIRKGMEKGMEKGLDSTPDSR